MKKLLLLALVIAALVTQGCSILEVAGSKRANEKAYIEKNN